MTLHLVHMPLVGRAFAEWCGRRGAGDAGEALHVLLSGLFGKGALQPFRLFAPRGGRRPPDLYAYSAEEAGALAARATAAGTPDALAVLDADRLRSKAMPGSFASGRRLGFDLRCRPVRRLGAPLADPSAGGATIAAGAEIDAFRHEALHRFPADRSGMERAGRTREAVYADWLAERLAGAARLETARLARFERRRGHRGGEGPDATLHGTLVVEDGDAFALRLARGVGRWRTWGYGMLLLRPPDPPPGGADGPSGC